MPVIVDSPMKGVKTRVTTDVVSVPDELEVRPEVSIDATKFSDEEIAWFEDLKGKGFHQKDIYKKAKVYLQLSDEKLELLKSCSGKYETLPVRKKRKAKK